MPPQVPKTGSGSATVVQQAPAEETKSSNIEKKPAEQPKEASKNDAPEPYRATSKEASNRKAELSTQGTAQRAALIGVFEQKMAKDDKLIELAKKTNADVMKGVNEAKVIAVAHKTNVDVMRTSLENSDTKHLRKVVAESEKWPEKNRAILNEAMGHSEVVMKKVAKEFTPDEQLKVINRSYETNNEGLDAAKKHESAVKAWMDNTKSSTLNHVLSNTRHVSVENQILKQVQGGDVGNFNKLNSETKMRVVQNVIGDRSSGDRGIQSAIGNINPKEKNMLIDKIQVSNPDEQLHFMKTSAKSLNSDFMEGIDKNNGEFMRKTYTYMAENAKTPEEKERYNRNAMYVGNWMDEKFKR